mgnify:CR=1 FL=1
MTRTFDSSGFHAEHLSEDVVETDVSDSDFGALEAMIQNAELEALERMTNQLEAQPQPMGPEEAMRQDILKLFGEIESAPDEEQIAEWKRLYGEDGVNVTAFGKEDVYVYTYVTLTAWEKITDYASRAAKSGASQLIERHLKEQVVRQAMLWPKIEPKFFESARAGLLESLYNAVLIQSYVLNPQQVLVLTTKL